MLTILKELKEHFRFTFSGAVLAVLAMFLIRMMFPGFLSREVAHQLFGFSHPLHVVLSAFVTSTIFSNYQLSNKKTWWGYLSVFLIGYVGSIGIATLSDCIVPYWGELFLGLENAQPHIGIIETPIVINLAAFLGIGLSFIFNNKTHFSHASHVLVSTAASLFHVMQAQSGSFGIFQSLFIALFLFLAVWLPCCFSDIVFPLLFIKKK
ncbi:MAG: hypothetical protein WCH76_01700 [Candidatus Riflemargulisbacteria bacterium]